MRFSLTRIAGAMTGRPRFPFSNQPLLRGSTEKCKYLQQTCIQTDFCRLKKFIFSAAID